MMNLKLHPHNVTNKHPSCILSFLSCIILLFGVGLYCLWIGFTAFMHLCLVL